MQVLWSSGVGSGIILGALIASAICYFAKGDSKIELFPKEPKTNGTSKSIFGADCEVAG